MERPRQNSRDPESLRFIRAIISRPATFTFIVLAANIFIFILLMLERAGDNPAAFQGALIAYGAKLNALIDAGQWWRFVTPVFLHVDTIHILVNMYSLFVIGPYVEKLYGSAKFVVFWVLTGIAGVAAGYFATKYGMQQEGFLGRFLFRGGDVPSAGASGALFGLVGVLFVFGIKFRRELPEEFKRAFGVGMVPTILINLFIGYAIPGIDNAAHLGGFLGGVVFALFVHYKRPGERAGVAIAWHIAQAAALVLVAVSFLMVARNFSVPTPPTESAAVALPNEAANRFLNALQAIGAGEEAFVLALNKEDASKIQAARATLEAAPRVDDETGQLFDELRSLLTRADAYLSQPSRVERERRQQQFQLLTDFSAWQARVKAWVASSSEKYGVTVYESAPSPPEQNPAGAK
ncbi:MAG TPA: rhomboid family intramembrane serine protease [Pyrinomonadaceae bacterium]|nr:rhomboid family intramembrane serine protease [Pyrinomonadaceae bacterium]